MASGQTNVAVLTERGQVKGEVHRAKCFIVTTRWPNLAWVPVASPATCGFCARAGAS
jgi:hypothetical protein